MRAIYALYSNPEAAQQAVNALRAAGIGDPRITILSSEPLEEYEFGQRDRHTLMPWLAGLGAACGLLTGYLLTSVTQNLWPINTGGMPIVTGWTNLIVIFELTMLGAVLTTVVTLLVTAKLPRRRPELYDPEISEGKILIGVTDPPAANVAALERTLHAGGLGTLKKIGTT
jgi:hypothetical protein